MRIIDYYNIVVSILTVGIALFFLGKKVVRQKGGYPEQAAADCRPARFFVQKEKDRLSALGLVCFFLVFALGCFLRFYHLTRLPDGLNQDEASIGYEAFSLAFYGVDRYGNPFPVYPITWGSGGGSPLLIYLTALSFKLFGVSVFVLRGTVAFFGCLTLPLFYLLVKEAKSSLSGLQSSPTGLQSSPTGLLGMLLLAIAPWHILLTRWTLDYGLIPFTFGLAILVLMKAARKKSTGLYVLASALAALNMYSYGSANIVIPAFLLLSVFFLMRGKILSVRQLFLCMLMFLLVCGTVSLRSYGFGLSLLFRSVSPGGGDQKQQRASPVPERRRGEWRILYLYARILDLLCVHLPGHVDRLCCELETHEEGEERGDPERAGCGYRSVLRFRFSFGDGCSGGDRICRLPGILSFRFDGSDLHQSYHHGLSPSSVLYGVRL